MKKYGRARQISDDNMMWCMRFAGWITTTKNTQSHTICNTCYFSMAKLLSENASILRYTYIARLVLFEERRISTKLELYRSKSPQTLRINNMYFFFNLKFITLQSANQPLQ